MPVNEPPRQIDPDSLDDYLEVMSKAVFQSGMSWRVVDAKWASTREAFHDFSVTKVASLSEIDLEELANDQRVIRNRRKLQAVVNNARRMIDLADEHGTFPGYLRAHGDFDKTLNAMKRDFKFMGPTGVYYFLYVVGENVPPHEEFEARYRK
jgi:DNA-3-methyladenine glycosylase I